MRNTTSPCMQSHAPYYGKLDPFESASSQLLHAAFYGEFDRFEKLALDYAKGEGIGVEEAIRKLINEDGIGSLHAAASGGSLEVCEYLLEKLKLDVDSKDGKGRTPLHLASLEGHFDIVEHLLKKGANADMSVDKNATPLHFAARSGDIKTINLLLSRDVRVDVATCSTWPSTPLRLAAKLGHRDAVKVLLDKGANPNGVDVPGFEPPLITAILAKSWGCMELLLEAGADASAVSHGITPLTAAVGKASVDGIKRLLDAGANPDYKDNLGMTALENAAKLRNNEVVETLFPVTTQIPAYPDWSIPGLMEHVNSDAYTAQREEYAVQKFEDTKSKGRDAFQREQYVKALHLFTEAMFILPKDAPILSKMSACYARLHDGVMALDYATKCIGQRPEWSKAYYRKGVALNILERYNEAAEAFSSALKLEPGNKELTDAYNKAKSKDRSRPPLSSLFSLEE